MMTAKGSGGRPAGLAVPAEICAVGSYLPERVVTNEEVVHGLDTTTEWVETKTGIRRRHRIADDETTSDMCIEAARTALRRAALDPADVDAVVLATSSQDQPLPSTGLVVAHGLGARRAWAIDLTQSACAGGVHGLMLASHLLQNDWIENVLVVGADCFSRFTDPGDRTTRVFFGDAAGAAVMRKAAKGSGLLSWDLGGELSHAVQIRSGGASRPTTPETARAGEHFLQMDGRAVWNLATTRLVESISNAVKAADLSIEDVQHVVVHQANLNIVRHVGDALGVPRERVLTTVGDLGNTGAASIFTVLDRLHTQGLVKPGDVTAVSAIGAGFMWATLCFRQGLQAAS